MSYPKLAYVLWSGLEAIGGKYMAFKPDEEKWVQLGKFLESFMESDESIPADFTVMDTVDPDTWTPPAPPP